MLRWICISALALTTACDRQPSQQALTTQRALESRIAENDSLRQAAARADAANARYEDCLSDADTAYRSRWNATCARLRRDDLQQRAGCRAGGRSDEACMSIEVAKAVNCALPTDVANNYDASYRDDQRLCLGRLRVEY